MTTANFSDVFVEAGNVCSIIDVVDPSTGLSSVNRETLEQVRQRYPTAEQMTWENWQAQKAAMQNRPLTWHEVTERQYQDMLEVLPPAYWDASGFLVGEPDDHCVLTGRPRFAAYIARYGKFYHANRPMTVKEFKAVR